LHFPQFYHPSNISKQLGLYQKNVFSQLKSTKKNFLDDVRRGDWVCPPVAGKFWVLIGFARLWRVKFGVCDLSHLGRFRADLPFDFAQGRRLKKLRVLTSRTAKSAKKMVKNWYFFVKICKKRAFFVIFCAIFVFLAIFLTILGAVRAISFF
jgi:hypothetical protein